MQNDSMRVKFKLDENMQTCRGAGRAAWQSRHFPGLFLATGVRSVGATRARSRTLFCTLG